MTLGSGQNSQGKGATVRLPEAFGLDSSNSPLTSANLKSQHVYGPRQQSQKYRLVTDGLASACIQFEHRGLLSIVEDNGLAEDSKEEK